MTKAEYLRELENELESVPFREKREALQYVDEYFDEAGNENSDQVICELGTPQAYAQKLKNELPQIPPVPSESQQERSSSQKTFADGQTVYEKQPSGSEQPGLRILQIVLSILCLPVAAVGVLFAGMVLLFCVMAVIALVLFLVTLMIGSVCGFFVYIFRCFASIPVSVFRVLFFAGLVLVCAGLFCLCLVFLRQMFTWMLPGFFSWIRTAFKKICRQLRMFFEKAWKGAAV